MTKPRRARRWPVFRTAASAFVPVALGVLAAGLLAVGPAAADDPLLSEAMGLRGAAMFLGSGAPAMVLAVVRGDRSQVQGYGEVKPGGHQEPDGSSELRLGSISKVFATDVLASLVADGTVRLTDPLQRYAGDVTVPTLPGARPMTLLDLATYAAALPREIGAPPDDAVPRTWPTRADRWRWLASYQLPWPPGRVAAYSNVGFDLLGDAMETAAGQSYAALLKARVTGPLAMSDTTAAPTARQCAALMQGSGLGGAAPCVDNGATAASGGLYSTADDMVRWLRHEMTDPEGVLALSHAGYRPRAALAAAIGFDEAGDMAALGLGWVLLAAEGARPPILAKSGGGAGFMTYAAFVPGKDVGVFVAVNRVDLGMFQGLAAAADGLLAGLAVR